MNKYIKMRHLQFSIQLNLVKAHFRMEEEETDLEYNVSTQSILFFKDK